MLEVVRKYFCHGSEEEREVILFTKSFEPMDNLRLLQIDHVKLKGKTVLPAELKWLRWRGCPLKSLPCEFSPPELTVLDISESKIQQLWGRRWRFGYNNKVCCILEKPLLLCNFNNLVIKKSVSMHYCHWFLQH